jgi:hypothetical protein
MRGWEIGFSLFTAKELFSRNGLIINGLTTEQ